MPNPAQKRSEEGDAALSSPFVDDVGKKVGSLPWYEELGQSFEDVVENYLKSFAQQLISLFNEKGLPVPERQEIMRQFVDLVIPPPPPLPEKPPELWSDETARRFATPRAFVEEIYKDWLNTNLSWPYLRKDKPLYHALRYQLTKDGIDLNDYLPSKAALVDHDLKRAGPDGMRNAARLIRAAERRR